MIPPTTFQLPAPSLPSAVPAILFTVARSRSAVKDSLQVAIQVGQEGGFALDTRRSHETGEPHLKPNMYSVMIQPGDTRLRSLNPRQLRVVRIGVITERLSDRRTQQVNKVEFDTVISKIAAAYDSGRIRES